MHPTLAQRLFATKWPALVTLLAGTAGVVAWVAPVLAPDRASIVEIVWFIVEMVAAALIGLIVAAFFGVGVVLVPLWRWRMSKNGAPFQVGDQVMILAGPHRDRIVRIYDVWPTRGEVRVELGQDERNAVTDVFGVLEVCRHPAVE